MQNHYLEYDNAMQQTKVVLVGSESNFFLMNSARNL